MFQFGAWPESNVSSSYTLETSES